MNLQSLSDQQLIELKKQKEMEHSQNNNLQMASKILLNSGYGALANSSFLYFRVENAESITTTGQMVNRWSSERTNNLINNLLKNKQKNNYVTCNDTDSVVGESLIYVNGVQTPISEYFDSQSDYIVNDDFNSHYVVRCHDDVSYGSDQECNLVEKPIKYVMKHKVKKRMYRVKLDGKEVTITEDHGLMVVRNDNLIKVKPSQVRVSDKLVVLK